MRAKFGKRQAAIADYSTVIEMKNTPTDIRAMALYNRALVHNAAANPCEAIADLNQVLEMAGIAENIKTEAHRKLVRMARATKRTDSLGKSVDSRAAID